MKRKKHTPEQIVKLLNESEPRLVSGEVKMADICRELGVSVSTYSSAAIRGRAAQLLAA